MLVNMMNEVDALGSSKRSMVKYMKYASAHVPYIFNGAWNDVMGI